MSVRVAAALALASAFAVAGCGAEGETPAAETPTEPQSEHCVDHATFKGDEPEDAAPAWSPDGRLIAFHSNRSGEHEIWTIDFETCASKRVTPGEEPDWSPDGASLVFTRWERGTVENDVWTAAADGSGVRAVTDGAGDSFPAWSPRDDVIAFDRDALIEEEQRREIHVVNSDGTGLRKLMDGGWNITPSFSPDGAWIAWARGDGAIWRMRSDGSEAEKITSGTENGDTDPSWSPDGRTIAYTHSTTTIGVQPWLVELENGEETPLVDMPGASPDWSPDGEWLVFERQERSGWFLWLVRPDGTGLRPLTAPG